MPYHQGEIQSTEANSKIDPELELSDKDLKYGIMTMFKMVKRIIYSE